MLKSRLEEGFQGSRFHSFLSCLKGVSDADARWKPSTYKGFPHMDGSILNLAYHTGGDKHVLMSIGFGDGSVTWPVVQSRFEELGGDLPAAQALSEEGHSIVLKALESAGETGLDSVRPYYGGKTLTAYEIFTIVAEHDIYHAGQIWYVRNMLAGLRTSDQCPVIGDQ